MAQIHAERPRRKSINHLYQSLRSLLPIRNPKQNDRCTIITETIEYINKMHQKLEGLHKHRANLIASITSKRCRMSIKRQIASASSSSGKNNTHSDFSVAGEPNSDSCDASVEPKIVQHAGVYFKGSEDVLITVTAHKMLNILSEMMSLLQKLNVQVVAASVLKGSEIVFFTIHAKATNLTYLAREELRYAIEHLDNV